MRQRPPLTIACRARPFWPWTLPLAVAVLSLGACQATQAVPGLTLPAPGPRVQPTGPNTNPTPIAIGTDTPMPPASAQSDELALSGPGITDPSAIVAQNTLAQPAPASTAIDPGFGTTIRRISGASAANSFETHIYSQLQAFSTDNAYILLTRPDGYLIRRHADLSQVPLDTAEWNAPRWQPAQPHTVVHYDTNADAIVRVQYTDLDTLQTSTVFTFPAIYQTIRSNQSFDELSRDGRWMAGMAQRTDGAPVIFALDLVSQSLGAVLPVPELYAGPCEPDPQWGQVEPDWIGVSPLGRYLVVQWPRDGTTRCSGLETFDLETGAFLGRVTDGHQHGDLGLLADGDTEIFVTFELYHPGGQLAIGYRALPGTATVSEPVYLQTLDWFGAHISCQGPAGVCLVTTDADPANGWQPFEGELYLLATTGEVQRLAHHRTSNCGYWVQPRGSISTDGRYVIFASDWGVDSCGGGFDLGAGDPYVVGPFDETSPPGSSLFIPVVLRSL